MSYVDGEGRETQRVIWPIQLSFMMSKPAEIEQMAMSISAWSWIVEWRLILKRSAGTPAYVVFICREIVEQGELKTYWQRVSETLVSHKARVLMDHGRFLILEGRGPVHGVTIYEFPTKDAARSWYDSEAYQEVRQHRTKGAKYLIVLAEGGVPSVEQRMPQTRVAGSAA